MSHAGRITTDFMTTENPIQPKTQPEPQVPALRSGDLFGEVSRLKKELADEKSDHADTQAKWNEALDKGLALLAENEKLHEEAMRHKGLLRLEELARMAERRACEALEAENRGLADEIVKLTNELLEAQERNRAFSSPNIEVTDAKRSV